MKINIDLFNVNSIEAAIQQIDEYKSKLESKCEQIVRRLVEEGVNAANIKVSESPIGQTITIQSSITPEQAGCSAAIVATGKTVSVENREPFYTVLAVEFGAGIHYNQTANPKSAELGFGVGTYPGQVHAFEDGWYYFGEDGQWHHTNGVKATMPMYTASQKIIEVAQTVAKEVFANG